MVSVETGLWNKNACICDVVSVPSLAVIVKPNVPLQLVGVPVTAPVAVLSVNPQDGFVCPQDHVTGPAAPVYVNVNGRGTPFVNRTVSGLVIAMPVTRNE